MEGIDHPPSQCSVIFLFVNAITFHKQKVMDPFDAIRCIRHVGLAPPTL